MHLFYAPHIQVENRLSEEESRHAVRVLRLVAGDEICLVDGVGGFYKALITLPHPKHCAFEITEVVSNASERKYRLHIAIAPTKNIERFEWFIEKCTEIGIDEITPVVCRFSERKQLNAERIERVVVAAAKQSLQRYFPKLNPLCRFEEFVKRNTPSQRFIAHCYEGEKQLLQTVYTSGTDCTILIGPEGDFSREEIEIALSLGFTAVSLGNSRLRTETAGIVACHTVAMLS